jgi:hypothetical protein
LEISLEKKCETTTTQFLGDFRDGNSENENLFTFDSKSFLIQFLVFLVISGILESWFLRFITKKERKSFESKFKLISINFLTQFDTFPKKKIEIFSGFD